MTFEKPRQIAVRALHAHWQGAGFIEDLLDKELSTQVLSSRDRSLARELVCGVVRWKSTLDWLIAQRAQRSPRSPILLIILRLGIYQLFWLDRIPPHAVVFETVGLAKAFGLRNQSGFVNAVLRGFERDFDSTKALLGEMRQKDPALGFSHPRWLWDRWSQNWGTENARQLLDWNNQPPPVFARVNRLRPESADIQEVWRREGVDCVARQFGWEGDSAIFELRDFPPLAGLPSYRKGWFYVQDPSTLLAVEALEPAPGTTVLDVCAAPGGKTALIAERMRNQGNIIAHDAQLSRLERVRENCRRLGVTCVEAVSQWPASDAAGFDKVLVDAPCSNTGVMRRRVDLRWRVSRDAVDRLAAAQLQLLRQAATRLRQSGTLVYSTCSLEPEENRLLVRRFLDECPTWTLEFERALLPFKDGVDGAYVARLRR